MVTLEHAIVQAVYAAKTDTAAADAFVQQYLPFVRAETVRFTRQAIEQGHEDELSIALLAFYEAILSYEKGRGAFLPYAARAIRNRLIDHFRAERRHRGQVSMQASAGEDGRTLADTLPDPAVMEDDCERRVEAERLRRLIRTLPERERCLITWRYGLDGAPPRTQQQVAARLGVSRSYVSRLEKRVVTQLAQRWQNE